jgi:hypothetical protein
MDKCNLLDNNCDTEMCKKICEECQDTDCEWVVNKLKPSPLSIELLPIVHGAKVKFQHPVSDYRIHSYTIILQNKADMEQKSFLFPKGKDITETNVVYEIVDLNPSMEYIVYAYSTNRFGDSPMSNRISFKPRNKGKGPEPKKAAVHEMAYTHTQYNPADYKTVLEKILKKHNIFPKINLKVKY